MVPHIRRSCYVVASGNGGEKGITRTKTAVTVKLKLKRKPPTRFGFSRYRFYLVSLRTLEGGREKCGRENQPLGLFISMYSIRCETLSPPCS